MNAKKSMDLELLREQYAFELSRKQQLESSLTFPVAVLTALGGVAFSYGKSFAYARNLNTVLFSAGLLGAVLSFTTVFYYLVKATHRFMYEVIPSALELLSYSNQVKEYYQIAGTPFEADIQFESRLKGAYADASSKNRQNNISKAAYLYRANMGLVAGAIFLALCAVPYLVNESSKPPGVQRVDIVIVNSQP